MHLLTRSHKPMSQAATDTLAEATKAAPAVAVAITGATGAIDWSNISYMLVALYTLLQIGLLIPRYFREWRRIKRGDIEGDKA